MAGGIEQTLGTVRAWALGEPAINAVALVGSWAREAADGSDVDLVVLTDSPERFVEGEDWAKAVGGRIVATRRWGVVTERRVELPDGLELDIGFAPTEWARTDPIDPGTKKVVRDGLRVIHDPRSLLAQLLAGLRP